ncbi:MAG: PilX N-terminal domain-containing pilus assembly protein [candidate division NC10 bacterium]|jgi:cytoskeletal protein CcmA (bactofilin family)
MKGLKKEEGIALVITLLIMTLLLVMGTAFLSISSTETLISINERNRFQAFHVAEAGSERAIAELNVNGAYAGTGGEQALGFGTYEATVTDLLPLPGIVDRKQVVSMGYVPNSAVLNSAMAQVQVDVQRGSPFKFAMLGIDFVNLDDRVVVDSYDSAQGDYDPLTAGAKGDIKSNGDINLDTNNIVKGSVQAGGDVTLGFDTNITGPITDGVSPTTFIAVNTSYQPTNSNDTGISPPGAYDSGTRNLFVANTVTLDPGTYYFNRIDLNAGATLEISGPVIIYMTGPMHAVGGGMINTSKNPANLLIFSSASGFNAIELDAGTGEFYGAVYLLDGEFDIDDSNWKFYGSIIAKEVDIDDDVEVHYDVALAKLSIPAGKFRPAAGTWRELFP